MRIMACSTPYSMLFPALTQLGHREGILPPPRMQILMLTCIYGCINSACANLMQRSNPGLERKGCVGALHTYLRKRPKVKSPRVQLPGLRIIARSQTAKSWDDAFETTSKGPISGLFGTGKWLQKQTNRPEETLRLDNEAGLTP
jgi:hypothetical protein